MTSTLYEIICLVIENNGSVALEQISLIQAEC